MLSKYGKVAVIMGGDTTEREVSILSGTAVLESLKRSGVDAYSFDPLLDSLDKLTLCNRAVVMMHGKNGEDGKLQGLLEYLKIPYTGSGVMASSLCMDKYRTKLVWQSVGIPVAKSQYVQRQDFLNARFKLELDLPVVVKPVDDGSTLGLSKVYTIHELNSAMNYAFSNSQHLLIEDMIIGGEFAITIIDGVTYPIIKIEAPDAEYDFLHKYYSDETKYICPYSLGKNEKKVLSLALKAYYSVGASGVARIDFMLDTRGQIFFLEINTIPGMTGHSLVPQALKAVGVDFDKLCLIILDGAGVAK